MTAGRAPEAFQGRIIPADELAAKEAAASLAPKLASAEEILKEVTAKQEAKKEVDPRIAELEIAPDEELIELADLLELDFAECLDTEGELVDRESLLQLLVDNGASLTQEPRDEH